jgi:hypothetical protein
MENWINQAAEKRTRSQLLPELKGKDFSQFVADIDKVWLHGKIVENNDTMLETLETIPESDAAQIIVACIAPLQGAELSDKLAAIGISIGELTDNRSIPSGVHGAIGEMIYGKNTQSVAKFMQQFNATSPGG